MREGWETKKLHELCQIELGKTPYRGDKTYWDIEKETDNVWLSIADLLKTPIKFQINLGKIGICRERFVYK